MNGFISATPDVSDNRSRVDVGVALEVLDNRSHSPVAQSAFDDSEHSIATDCWEWRRAKLDSVLCWCCGDGEAMVQLIICCFEFETAPFVLCSASGGFNCFPMPLTPVTGGLITVFAIMMLGTRVPRQAKVPLETARGRARVEGVAKVRAKLHWCNEGLLELRASNNKLDVTAEDG